MDYSAKENLVNIEIWLRAESYPVLMLAHLTSQCNRHSTVLWASTASTKPQRLYMGDTG